MRVTPLSRSQGHAIAARVSRTSTRPLYMAMSLLYSGPQRTASERAAAARKRRKKSSIDATSAAYTGSLRAESSSASPVVLTVVVIVDAIEPARLKPPLRGCA